MSFKFGDNLYKTPMYIEKQIIIVVQASPKNQPGGVQGALFKLTYQLVIGPLFINQLPIANAPKFMTKKMMMYFVNFINNFELEETLTPIWYYTDTVKAFFNT